MQVIFLTGHRKSGTTLLQRLFDGHPDLNIYPPDMSLFYGYFPNFSKNPNDDVVRERIFLVAKSSFERAFSRLPKSVLWPDHMMNFPRYLANSMPTDALRSREKFLKKLLYLWIEYNNLSSSKPIVIKETSQAIFFEKFRTESDLKIKMLNLTRDPRDNYAALKSGINSYYSKISESENETLASTINRIRVDFEASAALETRHPTNFQCIRFEDLIQFPERVTKQISEFMGFPHSDCMLKPTTLGHSYLGNNHDGNKFDGISSNNLGRWNERISEEEVKIIEFWLGDLMHRRGYQTFHDPADRLNAASKFYDWYNHSYFFHDSFTK